MSKSQNRIMDLFAVYREDVKCVRLLTGFMLLLLVIVSLKTCERVTMRNDLGEHEINFIAEYLAAPADKPFEITLEAPSAFTMEYYYLKHNNMDALPVKFTKEERQFLEAHDSNQGPEKYDFTNSHLIDSPNVQAEFRRRYIIMESIYKGPQDSKGIDLREYHSIMAGKKPTIAKIRYIPKEGNEQSRQAAIASILLNTKFEIFLTNEDAVNVNSLNAVLTVPLPDGQGSADVKITRNTEEKEKMFVTDFEDRASSVTCARSYSLEVIEDPQAIAKFRPGDEGQDIQSTSSIATWTAQKTGKELINRWLHTESELQLTRRWLFNERETFKGPFDAMHKQNPQAKCMFMENVYRKHAVHPYQRSRSDVTKTVLTEPLEAYRDYSESSQDVYNRLRSDFLFSRVQLPFSDMKVGDKLFISGAIFLAMLAGIFISHLLRCLINTPLKASLLTRHEYARTRKRTAMDRFGLYALERYTAYILMYLGAAAPFLMAALFYVWSADRIATLDRYWIITPDLSTLAFCVSIALISGILSLHLILLVREFQKAFPKTLRLLISDGNNLPFL